MLTEAPPYSGDPAVGEGLEVRGPDDEMRAGRNRVRRVLLAECFTVRDTPVPLLGGFGS